MTTAKILSALPKDGHGLTPRLAQDYYQARHNGDPLEELVVVARLRSCGSGEDDGKAVSKFTFEQFEVVAKEDERLDTIASILADAEERRVGHRQLPLDYDARSDPDQRRFLLGLIEDDWAAEEGLSAADIAERWRTFWGIESDAVPTDGAFPHPDYKHSAPHHLREFALRQGALADEPASVLQDGAGLLVDDDTDDEDATEATA